MFVSSRDIVAGTGWTGALKECTWFHAAGSKAPVSNMRPFGTALTVERSGARLCGMWPGRLEVAAPRRRASLLVVPLR